MAYSEGFEQSTLPGMQGSVRKTSEIKLKRPIRARVRQAKEFTFTII